MTIGVQSDSMVLRRLPKARSSGPPARLGRKQVRAQTHGPVSTPSAMASNGQADPAASSEANALCEEPTEAQRDRDLVARHHQGDRTAFEEFYRRFAPLVYNLAIRQCGDPELAKDLSQEAFLRLFRNLSKFEGRSSLKTWTYRVVLNHCRTRLSRRKRHEQLAVDRDGAEREIEDVNRGPEARTEAADSRRQIAEALLLVEPSYREALVLREIEDLSYQEIAEVLEVPIGTVRSRIARGREGLRAALLSEEQRNALGASEGGAK